ncbi:MAG: hypothetical protein PHQ34_11680, partial [Methanothrix sp.]|nr:hypothetical protein [Methanothrix sp.]
MSTRFLALAFFLILFSGIAGCTNVIESLGENAAKTTANLFIVTAHAMESLGEKATDATVDAIITTANAVESIGKNFGNVAGPVNSAISTVGEEASDKIAGGLSSGWQVAENVLGQKPEVYGEGRLNLFIGGIRQDSKDPEENGILKDLADASHAVYIPTYYSGLDEQYESSLRTSQLGGSISDTAEASIGEDARRLGDGVEVALAAEGFATYYNGLANNELKEHYYSTIASYSGGTASALIAIDKQGVTCNKLILISPMKALLSSDYYADAIKRILEKGYVKNILVITSPEDKPTGDLDFYQAKKELFGDDKRITISDVQLTSNGEQAHKDLLKYYIENIHNGEFV